MGNIKIKIDFYDDEQKELIKINFPKDFELISKFEGKCVELPIEDFKTYAFFRHQYVNKGKQATFFDLKQIAQNWGHYDLYFELNNDGALVNIFQNDRIEALDVQEMLGVAGGLSVASSLYGLTQADWTKIPITNKHKDFDFLHTSTISNRFINIETKGSIVDDNSYKRPAVVQHKANILEKKADKDFIKKYPQNKDTCLGIISVADRTNVLQAWLVDPPFDDQDIPPLKVKLLQRLYFYHALIRLISKRSYVALTLANRIKAIELTNDYEKLDSLPLLTNNFEKLYLTENFINSRSFNKEKSTIGKTFLVNKDIFYLGIATDLFRIIINQNFDAILSIKSIASTKRSLLDCKISKKKVQNISLFDSNRILINKKKQEDHNYVFFEMETDEIQNTSGLALCRLEL